MNVLGSADKASAVILRGCRGGRGAVLDRGPLCRLRGLSRLVGSIGEYVFLQVAEEQEGSLRRPHREVCVLGLHDSEARGPAPRVVDVGEGDFDGVGSGSSFFV